MKMNFWCSSLLCLQTFGIMAQAHKGDSLVAQREYLKSQIDSIVLESKKLNESLNGCSNFEITKNPDWSAEKLRPLTFYQNCSWSGTYIVLNNDSTFLVVSNGEGPANYAIKGKYKLLSKKLELIGSRTESLHFQSFMTTHQKKTYKTKESFLKTYIFISKSSFKEIRIKK